MYLRSVQHCSKSKACEAGSSPAIAAPTMIGCANTAAKRGSATCVTISSGT